MDHPLIILLATLVATSALAWANDEKPSSANSFKASDAKYMPSDAKLKWISEMRTQLPIVQRKTGPFGFSQDLSVKKIKPIEKRRVVQANVFPKAIIGLSINVVFGKSFLIGSQEIKEGQVFPLVFKGDTSKITFNVKVVSVRSTQITFKNMATGETAIKKIGGLPKGFEKAKGFNDIPGVTPDGQAQGPIEVQDKTENSE